MVSLETNAAQLNHPTAYQNTRNHLLIMKDSKRLTNSKRAHRSRQWAIVALLSPQVFGIH